MNSNILRIEVYLIRQINQLFIRSFGSVIGRSNVSDYNKRLAQFRLILLFFQFVFQ